LLVQPWWHCQSQIIKFVSGVFLIPPYAGDARRRRVGGIFQTAIGVFLLALMGTITWRMTPMLLTAPEVLADGSHFNASRGAARLVLTLFASVMLFGCLATTIGIRQAVTGTRPRRLIYVLWAAGALILVLALLMTLALKRGQA
jgi:hypothetical protein